MKLNLVFYQWLEVLNILTIFFCGKNRQKIIKRNIRSLNDAAHISILHVNKKVIFSLEVETSNEAFSGLSVPNSQNNDV